MLSLHRKSRYLTGTLVMGMAACAGARGFTYSDDTKPTIVRALSTSCTASVSYNNLFASGSAGYSAAQNGAFTFTLTQDDSTRVFGFCRRLAHDSSSWRRSVRRGAGD